MTKSLTPQAFDSLAHGHARQDKIIWTAAGIGRRLGRSEDYVRRTLARMSGTPVRRLGRSLYAFEDDLIAFMRDAA